MQVKVFTIPLFDNDNVTNELNAFLRSQKVLTLDKQLVTFDGQACWSFCVTYLTAPGASGSQAASGTKQGKVDYKEVLDPDAFAVFASLRLIRKQIAEQDAVPAYAVFTDSELAEIAKLDAVDAKSMLTIPGIGQKKVEKYGVPLSQMYQAQKGQPSENTSSGLL